MLKLPISDHKGRIYIHPGLEAAGMEAGLPFRLGKADLIRLPPGSRLFMLPHRAPIGYDGQTGKFMILDKYNAVAAFTPPGFTVTHTSAYREIPKPAVLPLFSYAACAFHKGAIYAAAVRVDNDRRHDPRFIDIGRVRKRTVEFRRILPGNRLVRHLERCALAYGCPNAQNFFLSRYEAPLPVSPRCNASCAGCISYQASRKCPAAQPRIEFVPTPEEIRDIALYHISKVKDPIVSFGQGCEGEPLLFSDCIEKAIRLIRSESGKGIIHINTNGSRPKAVSRLLDAGLNSIRVSMNSARRVYYTRYYHPKGYSFADIMKSIKIAGSKGAFLSINYLTMPGFTDSDKEFGAFKRFLDAHKVDMIQWRNLNFDPVRYFKELKVSVPGDEILGIRKIIASLRKLYPRLKMGYFNPFYRK